MFDHIDDVIKLAIEAIEKIHNKSYVCHRSINVCEKIRQRSQLLAVSLNVHVTNLRGPQLIVKLNHPFFFVVAKLVLNTNPYISCRTACFE